MNIIWKPNPLRTVVELNDAEKVLLRHRIHIEELEEQIGTVRFALNPEDREWHNKHIGPRSLEEAVTYALQHLDTSWSEEDATHLDDRLQHFIEELAGIHAGDCTCVPCSCTKCYVEELVGVDTIPKLGKHMAHKILGAFCPRSVDGTEASMEEALEYLRDYRPVKGAGWERFSDEDFQQHVPRWKEDARKAYEWLLAYKQERFA